MIDNELDIIRYWLENEAQTTYFPKALAAEGALSVGFWKPGNTSSK